jgi:hypothetical protein
MMAIDEDRLEELQELWERETNDPDTQEWRDDLTGEEQRLVGMEAGFWSCKDEHPVGGYGRGST